MSRRETAKWLLFLLCTLILLGASSFSGCTENESKEQEEEKEEGEDDDDSDDVHYDIPEYVPLEFDPSGFNNSSYEEYEKECVLCAEGDDCNFCGGDGWIDIAVLADARQWHDAWQNVSVYAPFIINGMNISNGDHILMIDKVLDAIYEEDEDRTKIIFVSTAGWTKKKDFAHMYTQEDITGDVTNTTKIAYRIRVNRYSDGYDIPYWTYNYSYSVYWIL